jgi:hypothetical protein
MDKRRDYLKQLKLLGGTGKWTFQSQASLNLFTNLIAASLKTINPLPKVKLYVRFLAFPLLAFHVFFQ